MQHPAEHALGCVRFTVPPRARAALVAALGALTLPAMAWAQSVPPAASERDSLRGRSLSRDSLARNSLARDAQQREPPRSAAPTPAPPGGTCFAFSFGAWSPPLDPAAAGHALSRVPRDSTGAVRPTAPAGGGPGAAMTDPEGSEAALILFPEWWPAGVGVRFSAGAGANDTLRGIAQAFVANGRTPVPTASVTARRVPCGWSANTRPLPR